MFASNDVIKEEEEEEEEEVKCMHMDHGDVLILMYVGGRCTYWLGQRTRDAPAEST